MLKKIYLMIPALFIIVLLSAPAWAASDYSSMSTEKLAQMRETIHNAGEEERNAFRHEWQNRYQQMTEQERLQYANSAGIKNRDGQDNGTMTKTGYGTGAQSREQYEHRTRSRENQQNSFNRAMTDGRGGHGRR